jgi:hypothetical protein
LTDKDSMDTSAPCENSYLSKSAVKETAYRDCKR